jgi:TonB family protein
MIGSWMLYAVAVSALFTVAAHALERVVGARGRPRRMLWVVATSLSLAWPAVTGLRRLAADDTLPVTVVPFTITVPSPTTIVPVVTTPARGEQIDRALAALWVALSALLLLRLVGGIATLRRARRAWRHQELDGMPVCVSPNVGPAVVGLRSMHVVLPEWILDLDLPLRALVLRHEQEHRTARDPYLLFGVAAAVCLMPWNPVLWFQARRLRLAIELDCDARVLRAHPTPERYGLLMLTIAQRRSIAPTLFAPMLAEPATQIERRIIEMRTTTRRIARWTVVGGTVLAAGAVTLAGSLRAAGATSLRSAGVTTMQAVRSMGSEIAANTIPARRDVQNQQGNPAPRYPDMLRSAGVEGSVVVEVSTDANGIPDTSSMRVVASTHDLFAASVRQALAKWHLSPRANVRLPFLFVMSNKSATDMASVPAGTVVITGVPLSNPGVHVTSAVVVTAAQQDTPRTVFREAPVARRDTTGDPLIIVDGVVQGRVVRVNPTQNNAPDTVATFIRRRR